MRTGLASIFNVMEPVIRVQNIRSDGKIILAFNNDVIMPYDFEEQVREDRECERAAADPNGNEKVSNFLETKFSITFTFISSIYKI